MTSGMTDGLLLVGLVIAFAIAEIVRVQQWRAGVRRKTLDPLAWRSRQPPPDRVRSR